MNKIHFVACGCEKCRRLPHGFFRGEDKSGYPVQFFWEIRSLTVGRRLIENGLCFNGENEKILEKEMCDASIPLICVSEIVDVADADQQIAHQQKIDDESRLHRKDNEKIIVNRCLQLLSA